jgi:hypothetical protein
MLGLILSSRTDGGSSSLTGWLRDTPGPPSDLVEELSELSRATRVAELRERLLLTLTDQLAADAELGTDLRERPGPPVG